MKSYFSSFFCLSLGIAFSACSKKPDTYSEAKKEYTWAVVDSLDLNFLGNPMLSDVSPDGSKLLFYDSPSSKIIITDAKGQMLHQFSKKEDTPDSYGYMMERPGFFNQNQLAIYGRNGLFLFTYEGEMQKKIPHPESIGATGSVIHPGKSTESITLQGKRYVLPKSIRPRNSYPGEQEFYDTYRALELVDVDAEEMTEIIPFEQGSLFLNGKGYYPSDYFPAHEAKDETLYFVHGGDPQLYVYQLSQKEAKLDTIIQLEIPGLTPIEGKDRGEFQKGTVMIFGGTAAIRNIHILDDFLLLDYYAGIDPIKSKEAEAIWNEGKEEEAKAMYKKIEEETQKGTLVYSLEDLSFVSNVPPPPTTGGRSYASGGGFAWFEKLPNPDVEEDFLRIYKMKMVEK
ncbi:hypothetical protein JYB64_19060 [Algoriphagus aestuarii]|nr:hypothetical protein [Algoriphagus aestuarii]